MDPRRLLPVLAAVAAVCVVATLVVAVARPDDVPGTPRRSGAVPRAAAVGAAGGPAGVLARWDELRAAAWAAGDVDGLQSLYAVGSRAGAADVRLLRDYLSRGLRVDGLTTQVLGLEVVVRTPRRLVLDVVDRMTGGVAVGGPTPIALPAARASARRVVLVRRGERWVVAEVREQDRGQARAEASTSRTSSSSKS